MPRLEEQLEAIRGFIENEDMGELASTAHWLKGSGGNVGFAGFTKPAAALQAAAQDGDMVAVAEAMQNVESYASRVQAGWDSGDSANDDDADAVKRTGT